MKTTPLAQGTGVAGNTIDTGGPSRSDKIAAAKAIASGQDPIRVTESDNYIDPQVARAQASIKSIKMRTNVSPDRYVPPADVVGENITQPDPENAIIDPSVKVSSGSEETKPLSPQFAALARQKRALQVKEAELAKREEAAKAQVPQNTRDLMAELKTNPLKILQESGVTYQQLTDAILASQGNPEIQELKEEIKALKEGVDKNFSDRETQQEQAVLAQMRRETDQLVASGDAFEMIRVTKSQPEVIELIHRTFKTSGEVLDVSDACQLVEDHLIDESLKIARLKKVQGKLSTPAQTQQSQPRQRPVTLTNRDAAAPAMTRRERAMAAALGNLKK